MKNTNKVKISLVDDDVLYLKMLEIEFLSQTDFELQTFSTGEQCISNLSAQTQMIIMDYNLNGINKNTMDGIETLDSIKNYNSIIPVIMLSAQDKIDIVIKCMQHKANDYVVKSETAFVQLQQIVTHIFKYKKMESDLNWYMDRM